MLVEYGEYIPLFGLDHSIYVIGLIAAALCLAKFKERIRLQEKLWTSVILAVSLFQQYLLYTSYYNLFGFDLGESLPLHISRINSILGIVYLLSKNKRVYKLFVYFSLYSWTSFLYPSRVYGMTHPIGVSFFINHVITLLLPFYGSIAHGVKVEKGDRRRAYPWFVFYVGLAFSINQLVDGNYFYLKHKPVLSFLPDVLYIPLVFLFTLMLFNLGETVYIRAQKKL